MLKCSEATRMATCQLTTAAMRVLADGPYALAPPGGVAGADRPALMRFVETMLALLPQARSHWKSFGAFFTTLSNFAKIGRNECAYLVSSGQFARLLSFFLQDDSPHPELMRAEEAAPLVSRIWWPPALGRRRSLDARRGSRAARHGFRRRDSAAGFEPHMP